MLFGILCTYRRPVEAIEYLNCLEHQSLAPDLVVIVDNSPDDALRASIVKRLSSRTQYQYIHAKSNIGPAGAFRVGFDEVLISHNQL